MHVLITGGTGFVGQSMAPYLIKRGHKITVYSRSPDSVADKVDPACQAIGKLTPAAVTEPVDAIVNLAGEPIADHRWSDKQKRKLINSRVALTHSLVDFAANLDPRPKVLVSASAVGFYGDQQQQEVTEKTPPHDEFTHRLCSAWEDAASAAQPHGIRVAIARLGLVVGPGGFLKKMLPAFKLGLGGKLGDGKQFMPWIHRDDLVRIFEVLLTDSQASGAYNAVGPSPVTNAEFTRTLGSVLHRPTVFTVPAFVLKAGLGEMSGLLLTGQKALPKRMQDEQSFAFQYPTLQEALQQVLQT